MKSNKVRMNISRDMHEWFAAIDGDTNDERMQKLRVHKEKGEGLNKLYMQRGQSLFNSIKLCYDYQELYYNACDKNSALKLALAISSAISTISVGYIGYIQGWFV